MASSKARGRIRKAAVGFGITVVVGAVALASVRPRHLLDDRHLLIRLPTGSNSRVLGMLPDNRLLTLDTSVNPPICEALSPESGRRSALPNLSSEIARSILRKTDWRTPYLLSPDGRWVVFAWGPRNGPFEMVASSTDDSRKVIWKNKVSLGKSDTHWSGDSRRIYEIPRKPLPELRAYSLDSPGEMESVRIKQLTKDRWCLSAIGKDQILLSEEMHRPRELVQSGGATSLPFHMDWPQGGFLWRISPSPNGALIEVLVYVPLRSAESGWMNNLLSFVRDSDRVHLLVSRSDGTNTRNFGMIEGTFSNCYGPEDSAELLGWSADSRRIIFQHNENVYQIPGAM